MMLKGKQSLNQMICTIFYVMNGGHCPFGVEESAVINKKLVSLK